MPTDFDIKLRQAAIKAQRKVDNLLLKNRRQIKIGPKPKPVEARADGLTPQMVAALTAASKRVEEDPRAKALVDRAETARRIEETRKQLNIGTIKPAPETEFGRPIQTQPPVMPLPVKPVAEQLKEKKAKKK